MSEQGELNFENDDASGGFRLWRFEMLNWGTFNGGVRVIPLNGSNGLLTGEIGSGKSTVVDALTTLLISPARLVYNKAAGAESKERTLKSYVEGYYRSERADDDLSARPVALRGTGSYSVLLGYFRNESLNSELTIAQVFWMADGKSQPERLYAAAEKDLSIAGDFTGFGSDMKGLRKKLRGLDVQIFDTYPPYQGFMSRIFGIRSSQALNLFNQTVSMKTIGDLTGFVRGHMLERSDIGGRIENLIRHFDDLTGAHDAIVKAKKQIEMLTPIRDGSEEYSKKTEMSAACESASASVDCWIAGFMTSLLETEEKTLKTEAVKLSERLSALDAQKTARERQRDDLRADIAREGGTRLESIAREISDNERELERRKRTCSRYNEHARSLGLPACDSVSFFASNQSRLPEVMETIEDQSARIRNDYVEVAASGKKTSDNIQALQEELASLRARRSNIDSRSTAIRAKMAAALKVSEDELPFAGELIEVMENERGWEGAAERILHNFGLSVLVPDKYYKAASDWADKNYLTGRLVYFRVRGAVAPGHAPAPGTLASKLMIKEDSNFYHWLADELASRFSFVCCDSMDDFRRESKAVTKNGLVKSSDKRHEKDDRHRIDDRSRYILGWNNRAKIALLERDKNSLEKELATVNARQKELDAARRASEKKRTAADALSSFTDFADVDWKSASRAIDSLAAERDALQAASGKLDILNKKLAETEKAIREIESETIAKSKMSGENSNSQERCREELARERTFLAPDVLERCRPSFAMLESVRTVVSPTERVTLKNADKLGRQITDKLREDKKALDAEIARISSRLVHKMSDFKTAYILETQDFDSMMESLPEYLKLLEQLLRDDLPRFEAKFRHMLKEKTIQEIASFHENLNRSARDIEEKIASINEALATIDYEPNRYIMLEAEHGRDNDIRLFQSDLRDCTKDVLGDGEGMDEKRFANIEKIIARFRGRPESPSMDKKWTEKVTDVRNWYSFAASERWKEDGREYEHYSDSSGKSGGQKEKLAYTILAASLAYQFGVSVGEQRARTFRFVMIDEAFGRGSDESAQFALELFKTLNLQLLIVTPLQKIQVIEPYVSHVTFISNKDGLNSLAANLTIEEYMEKKKEHAAMDDGK